jgi:hypothetical protein
MTPQQKAMGQLLQVSLFKWADAVQSNINELKRLGVDSSQLDQIALNVEKVIDQTIEGTKPEDITMADLERINDQIVQLKGLIRD